MTIKWEGDYNLDGKQVGLEVEGEWCAFDMVDGYRVPTDYKVVKATAWDDDGKEIALTEEQTKRICADPWIYEQIEDDWCAQAEAWAERHP